MFIMFMYFGSDCISFNIFPTKTFNVIILIRRLQEESNTLLSVGLFDTKRNQRVQVIDNWRTFWHEA